MANRRITWVAAAVASVSIASAVFGVDQSTRPTDQPASRPQVVTPYWGQNDAGGMGGGYGAGTTVIAAQPAVGEQLLTTTVLAVPQASADAVVARWSYRRLDHQLNLASDGLRRDFRDSDEYSAAVNDFNNAYATLESARAAATQGLVSSPEYQAAFSLRRTVSDQIADAHATDEPDVDRLIALASLKLDYVTPLRSAEISVLARNSAVRDAKAKLLTAARAIAKMEKEFAKDVRDSIELAGIRKNREDARIAMLASSQYLDEMRLARAIAIDYAYVGQGFLPSGYGGYGSGNNGYNYGYSSYSGYSSGYSGGFYGGGLRNGSFANAASHLGYGSDFGSGAGSNAFFGRSGNAFTGGGPSKKGNHGDNNANPGNVFGTGAGSNGNIPSPFGTGTVPSPFGR